MILVTQPNITLKQGVKNPNMMYYHIPHYHYNLLWKLGHKKAFESFKVMCMISLLLYGICTIKTLPTKYSLFAFNNLHSDFAINVPL